jgi:sugar/nucleoside kinase (ribokinase family)
VHINGSYEQFFRGGTSYCTVSKIIPGGSGNVAAGLSAIGGTAAFVGKAGSDYFGKSYKQDLEKRNVVTEMFLDRDCPTGLTIVFVEDGNQRSFLVSRGANDRLSQEEIWKATNLVKRSKYVYFSGYSLVEEPQRSAILEAINLAKRFQKKIIFDPGASNLVKEERALFIKLLQLSDVFSPNWEEACAITNASDVNDVIAELRKSVPLTTLKTDQNGCILFSREKLVRVPSYNVKCVDPTGAGDAFTAGVIYGLSRKLSLTSIGQLANWFAAQVVTGGGARSFPEKAKLNHVLKGL